MMGAGTFQMYMEVGTLTLLQVYDIEAEEDHIMALLDWHLLLQQIEYGPESSGAASLRPLQQDPY